MSSTIETPPITADKEIVAAFVDEQRIRAPFPVRLACLLGITGFSAYFFADLGILEGAIQAPLIAWALIVGANLAVFGLSFSSFGKRHIHTLAVLSCLAMSIGVSSLTAMKGGAASLYHEALLLVLIGFSVLIPWGPLLAGMTFVLAVGSYDLVLLATGLTEPVGIWLVNNFILWTGVVICTVGVLVADRLRRIEFQNRFRLKSANDELSEALEKLKELDRLKTGFFANVSHELRTPLMLIISPLESLLAQPMSSQQRELLETVMVNARRLLRQVSTLLEAAKLEAGKLRLKLERGRPGRVVSDLVACAEPHARARDIELISEGLDDLPGALFDPEKLEVILANLLSNALKFTPPGGRVIVRGDAHGDRYRLRVVDTGPGIPEEQVERIFDRFYQVDDSSVRPQEGTGLGLALTKELVQLHGGTLQVTSRLGLGSTFAVELPREPAEPHPDRRRQFRRREDKLAAARWETLAAKHYPSSRDSAVLLADVAIPQLGGPTTCGGDLPPNTPRVLIVEDNPDLRTFVARELSSDYRVILAGDGIEGLEAAEQYKPDVIVTDIMMPLLNGYELCRRIRENSALAPTPILLVTAKSGSEALVEGLGVGADDYVTKPFDMRELKARIAAQLRAKTLERRLSERESRLAAVGQMTAAIVNDIRNPLTSVIGYAQMARQGLEEGEDPSESVDDLQTLLKEANRLKMMLAEVQEYATMGSLHLQMESTPVRLYLSDTIKLLERDLEPTGIELVTELNLDDDIEIPLDRHRIHHVLENLVTNARNALGLASSEENPPRIWLQAHVEGAELVLKVADNGPGIPAHMSERLFEPFASSGVKQGTGLGLVTVKNLMLAHGGTVSADSSATQGGAAFTLRLPCRPGGTLH